MTRYTEELSDEQLATVPVDRWEPISSSSRPASKLCTGSEQQTRDAALWAEAVEEEEEGLSQLQSAAERWEDIAEFLNGEN